MPDNFSFAIVSGATVHHCLQGRHAEVAAIVEQAYVTHGRKASVNPDSYFLRFPEKPSARIIALPAYLGDRFDTAGIKWISSFPDNIKQGFPRASAVLVLNRYDTGYPYALLEASIISAARTAASAQVAAARIVPGKKVRRMAFVGNGLIARYVHQFFVRLGWSIDAVALHDSNPAEPARFRDAIAAEKASHRVELCADLASALQGSDLIVLCTTAGTPYITDPALLRHNPVVLNISLRDLAPELLLASNNVVDDIEHVMKASTSPHLAEQLSGGRGFVNGTIPDLIAGRCTLAPGKPTIVSPFGLGVLDLAVGKWVYDQAVAEKRAVMMDDFFFELTR